ncbi:hypothetical protein BH09PSE5_BH09PSE5_15130 [soil metagenome]
MSDARPSGGAHTVAEGEGILISVAPKSHTRRWAWLTLPQLLFTGGVILLSQFVFLKSSLHEDTGLGLQSPAVTLTNYLLVWQDGDYLAALGLTLRLAFIVVLVSVLIAWPIAYVLSRMRTRAPTTILTAVIAASFIPLPIKALGLMILFSAEGVVMTALRALDLVGPDFRFIGSFFAVAVGYTHLAIGFMVTMLFNTLLAVPARLEEAAAIHGAQRLRVLWRVVLPLSLPGTLSASLVLFNLLTGAFVSAVLLGGGKILTLPVLIQRTLILDNDYGIAATLAVVLLVIVLAVNIFSVLAAARITPGAKVIT